MFPRGSFFRRQPFLLAAFPLYPDIREWSAQILYIENDRELIAAVSRALGESRRLIRDRGFQMIEIMIFNGDELLTDSGDPSVSDDRAADDTVDLAAVAGLDWDDYDDSRLLRRARGRRRRRVA